MNLPQPMNALRRRTGFTLVEILVSIAILSLVVAAIYSSWTAILRASKVGLDAAAAAQRSRIALQTLEDSLTTVELFSRNADYYWFEAENGRDASLSFVARLPKSFPRSGHFGDFDLRRLTYHIEEAADGDNALVLRQQPLVMEMNEDEQTFPLVLARDVKEFAMQFWDPNLADWVDEWLQTNRPPSLMKIKLSLGHPGSRSGGTEQEVTRVVALTSQGVPAIFQTPAVPGRVPVVGVPGVGLPGSGQPPVIPSPTPLPTPLPVPGGPQ